MTWIAERKNTLSMFFYLLSLGWFLRFDESVHSPVKTGKRHGGCSGFSVAAFALALLAKSSVAVLPAVLLLFVWWRRGRVTRRDLDRCIPFFILAVLMALVAVAIQSRAVRGGVGVIHDSLWVRLIGGSWAVWFYLGKIVLPAGLTMIYPRWDIDPRAAVSYLPALLLAGLLFLFWRRRRSWGRPFLFAVRLFHVGAGPGAGDGGHGVFFQFQGRGPFPISGPSGDPRLDRRPGAARRRIAPALAAGMAVAVLAFLTCRHEKVLANGRTLWEDNLAKNPNSWKVCMNLSVIFLQEGKTEEAIKLKNQADTLLRAGKAKS